MKTKIILTFSVLFLFAFAPQVAAQTTVSTVEATTITVKVTGVGCSTDIRTISTNVEKLAGVNSCEIEKRGATTRFTVSYDPDMASTDDIHTAIEDTPGCKNPNDRPYRVRL